MDLALRQAQILVNSAVLQIRCDPCLAEPRLLASGSMPFVPNFQFRVGFTTLRIWITRGTASWSIGRASIEPKLCQVFDAVLPNPVQELCGFVTEIRGVE